MALFENLMLKLIVQLREGCVCRAVLWSNGPRRAGPLALSWGSAGTVLKVQTFVNIIEIQHGAAAPEVKNKF